MERTWQSALSAIPPKKITDVVIELIYDNDQRPTKFLVSYKIEGDLITDELPNPVM